MRSLDWSSIENSLNGTGLRVMGGFHADGADKLPPLPGGRAPKSLVLVGNAGPAMWQAFTGTEPAGADPLDHWCREKIAGVVAGRAGAAVVYVSDGPPYWPFQAWALRCGDIYPSPLGILIHQHYGLWHAYRAAIVLSEHLAFPPQSAGPSPCESCADKPCLSACPVGAFTTDGYDVPSCVAQVAASQGIDCRGQGCRARRACPIGDDYRYQSAQASFHMAAFVRGNS